MDTRTPAEEGTAREAAAWEICEQYIRSIKWDADGPSYDRKTWQSIVAGNIRGFYGWLLENYLNALESSRLSAESEREEAQEQYNQLKVDAQLLLIECDAKTAALLQIVRRRAGSPAFEWCRRFAMAALTDEDHKNDQEWIDALTADALKTLREDSNG